VIRTPSPFGVRGREGEDRGVEAEVRVSLRDAGSRLIARVGYRRTVCSAGARCAGPSRKGQTRKRVGNPRDCVSEVPASNHYRKPVTTYGLTHMPGRIEIAARLAECCHENFLFIRAGTRGLCLSIQLLGRAAPMKCSQAVAAETPRLSCRRVGVGQVAPTCMRSPAASENGGAAWAGDRLAC
jgi:hypothetical protein